LLSLFLAGSEGVNMFAAGDHARQIADALERRLDVRRRARTDGAAGRDAEAGPAPVELEIAAEVAARREDLLAQRAAAQAGLERELRRLKPMDADFSAILADARLSLRQIEGRAAHEFAQLKERAERAKADLESFRRANGIRRGALYPESKLLSTGLLVVLAAIEAMASAPILASALDGGLAQGYLAAITLSGINAGIGLLGGYVGLRYLTQRKPLLFALGAIGFGLALFVGIFLNVFAALWRARTVELSERTEALAAMREGRVFDAEILAGERSAFSLLFDLQHGETMVLLMLGAIVLVAAFHKGFSSVDEPVPDYGKLDRASRAADEELAELREEIRDELEAPIEESRAAIEKSLAAHRAGLDAVRAAYDSGAEAIHTLDARLRAVADAGASLRRLYRKELAAARGVAPAAEPAGAAETTGDALEAPGAIVTACEASYAAAVRAGAHAREELLAALDAATGRLEGEAL
jgi:hypothetical protein